jgi:hypothetical protein
LLLRSDITLLLCFHLYREFVDICDSALKLNYQLISSDQTEYHESLVHYHRDMTERLSEIFGEQVSVQSKNIDIPKISVLFLGFLAIKLDK